MRNMKPLLMANSLHGFEIHAMDGASGRIDDFYFSDMSWNISHVAVDIGGWLTARKVLLLPEVLGQADWHKKHIEANLTRKQIGESPDSTSMEPEELLVDEQIKLSMMRDFATEGYPGMQQYIAPAVVRLNESVNPHLRSARAMKDYVIVSGEDKSIGRILDFLIDTETWGIRFLQLKTDDGRIFLAQPDIIRSIDTKGRTVTVNPPEETNGDWQEYDPHYMALLEIEE